MSIYNGGHLQSKESFLYGRFETMIKPGFGSGVVSSFFLFYDGKDYKDHWNEIDFEFHGKYSNTLTTNVIQTINHYNNKDINVKKTILDKKSDSNYWKLCIEWLPDSVTWKVNDVVIRKMSVKLNAPQKLMMNLWNGGPSFAGDLNPKILPQESRYSYVRYSAWERGKFVSKWQDDFKELDTTKWFPAEYVLLNTTNLTKENLSFENSELVLKLTL